MTQPLEDLSAHGPLQVGDVLDDHLAHATGADLRADFVGTEAGLE